MKKLLYIPALAVVGGISLLLVSTVQAQTGTATGPTIIERIANRFNLNATDVQNVFHEHWDARRQDMQKRLEERLAHAVSDGTITEAQKNALLAKHQEMVQAFENLKTFTPEERKTKMMKLHDDYRSWATAQGIPDEVWRKLGLGIFGHGFKMGPRMGHGMRKNQ